MEKIKNTLVEILKIASTHFQVSHKFLYPIRQMIKLLDKKFVFKSYTLPASERLPLTSASRIDMFNLLYTIDIPDTTDEASGKMKYYFTQFESSIYNYEWIHIKDKILLGYKV